MILERCTTSLCSLIEADKPGLLAIMRACEKLIDGKPIRVNELWPGNTPELTSLLSDRGCYKDAVTSLRVLKQASHALTQLQLSLDTKLRVAQQPITKAAHHYGIQSIPDELLSSIFSLLAADEYSGGLHTFTFDRMALASLALVNRKFRDIIYGTAECWSRAYLSDDIGSGLNVVNINILLERSRDASLKICWDGNASRFNLFRQLIARCKTLDITSLAITTDAYQNLKETLGPDSFANLETLRFYHFSFDDSCGRAEKKLLRDWRLPNLRHLSTLANGLIPAENLSQLTSLYLEGNYLDVSNLLEDIAKATCLLHLTLSLHDYGSVSQEGAMTADPTELRTTLSRLRTFELWVTFEDRDTVKSFVHHVEVVTRSLRMPNLESISIEFCDCIEDAHPYLGHNISFNQLFPIDESEDLHMQMAPTKVELCLSDFSFPHDAGLLAADYLSRFPSVQAFTMSINPETHITSSHCSLELARLRHLCIDGRYVNRVLTLERLLSDIFKEPVLNLETITLSGDGGEGDCNSIEGLAFALTKGNTRIVYRT